MIRTTVSSKYQIVIPKAARKKMNLLPGMAINIQVIDSTRALIHRQPKDFVDALSGLGKEVWKSLGGGDHYLKHERAVWGKK